MLNKKTTKFTKGLTLIELLVAITVFSIAIVAALRLFANAFLNQKSSLNSSYLLNNGSYVMEYMSRSLRMARKELDNPPQCLSQRGLNYEVLDSGQKIRFISHDGVCKEFYRSGNSLRVHTASGDQDLLPSDVLVQNLHFSVQGASQDDNIQPKVTIALEIQTQKEPQRDIKLQTTVSQRDLDVQE